MEVLGGAARGEARLHSKNCTTMSRLTPQIARSSPDTSMLPVLALDAVPSGIL